MRIELLQYHDDVGEAEEFTWDLFPLVEPSKTVHLGEHGLPRPGTVIHPGMIIVGKIGKTKRFDPKAQPSALEIHGMEFGELKEKYGGMWKDGSLYATEATDGVVQQAYLEETPSGQKAVVELESVFSPAETPGTKASAIPS